MVEIIGVRFKEIGKIYYFDPNGLNVKQGDHVIVETARGIECSEVMLSNRTIDEARVVQPLRKAVRMATEEDLVALKTNEKKAKDAYAICEKKIAEHKLDMKLIDVEYAFDGSKILFYFTADGRVDFRELVKDLAGVFRMRIELRQIGVRDEAKMYGGLGMCGRPLCCASFLDDFQPVSIKMAKEQGLSLNPTKISGTCGRLMCCLKYEQEAYEDLIRNTPKVDTRVATPDGVGTITEVNLLRGRCKVRLENSTETPKFYPKEELGAPELGCTKRCEECHKKPIADPVWEPILITTEEENKAEKPSQPQRDRLEQRRDRRPRQDRPRQEHGDRNDRSETGEQKSGEPKQNKERGDRAPRQDRPKQERNDRNEGGQKQPRDRKPQEGNRPPRQDRKPKPQTDVNAESKAAKTTVESGAAGEQGEKKHEGGARRHPRHRGHRGRGGHRGNGGNGGGQKPENNAPKAE